jgi:hypothetical protein
MRDERKKACFSFIPHPSSFIPPPILSVPVNFSFEH